MSQNWKQQEETLKQSLQDLKNHEQVLKDENTLLHSQMEQFNIQLRKLSGNPSDAATSAAAPSSDARMIEELRELIRILRRDKEILQSKLSISEQESKRHVQRYEETSRLLEDARIQIESLKQQSKEDNTQSIINSLQEQLNLYRESNQTLRNESQAHMQLVDEWKDKYNSLQLQVKPLNQQVEQMKTEMLLLRSENEQLKSDVAKWQERSKTLLDKYKQIDPDEYRQVQEELAAQRQETARLTQEIQTLRQQMANNNSTEQHTYESHSPFYCNKEISIFHKRSRWDLTELICCL